VTEIVLNPSELHAMASVISDQTHRIDEATAGIFGTQGLLSGPALAVAGELEELAKQTLLIGAIYIVNAIDIETRAESIEADQAQVSATTTPTDLDAALAAGGSVIGGTEPGWSVSPDLVMGEGVVGGSATPVSVSGGSGNLADDIMGNTGVGAADPEKFNATHPFVHLMEQDRFRPAPGNEMSMLETGIFRRDGVLYDASGNATTDPSHIYFDSVTGTNRIRP
jgi:hypothetical protein